MLWFASVNLMIPRIPRTVSIHEGDNEMFKRFSPILLLLVLGAFCLYAVSGCSDDDGVTPNEELEITAEDAAQQAAFVAVSLMEVLDDLSSKDAALESVDEDCVYGSYWREDLHVWTEGTHVVTVDFDCDGTADDENNGIVTFDITKTGDQANGSGGMDLGSVDLSFTLTAVELYPSNYPAGGTILVDTSGYTATITFYADHTADVTVGSRTWAIDLSDGGITEI